MERSQVVELHYITPIDNLPSIRQRGLLCHKAVQSLPHRSVALSTVQSRRAAKQIPGGLALHEYVNLYLHARNPMMFFLKSNDPAHLAVIRVSPAVLDLPGAIISDGNSASGPTRFFPSPGGLTELNANHIFARYWTHPDQWEQAERKRARCAEVLIPGNVPVQYLRGVFVRTQAHAEVCGSNGWSAEVNTDVFFG